MTDEAKTKEQLISELRELRHKVHELEISQTADVQLAAQLEQRAAYSEAAIHNLNEGIIVVNQHGENVFFNPAAQRMVGVELIDADPREWPAYYGLYTPDQRTLMDAEDIPLARALSGEAVEDVELFIRNTKVPDGIYISVSAHPLERDGVKGGVVIFRDITVQRQMEENLRLSEERYRLLAENFPKSAILVLDHDLRFILADGPELAATGFSKDALEGKTLHEAVPPEFAQVVEPNIRAALSGKFFTAELPWQEEQYYQYSYVPLTNSSGDVVSAMILAQNITERKAAEDALYRSEEALRVMLNATHDIAFMMDVDWNILVCNERLARSMGMNVEQIVGKRMSDLLPRELAQSRLGMLQRVFATGEPVHFEDQRQGRIFDNNVYPVKNLHNVVDRVAIFVRDVTEAYHAEEQLRLLNQAIDQSPVSVKITDTDGVIQYVNPTFGEITGYTPPEVIGQPASILNSGEHSQAFYQELWDTITAGQVWRGEFRNKKKNGDLYWELGSIVGVKDAGGNITHYVWVGEDVTLRKQLEEERVRQDRLAAVGQLAAGIAHDFNNVMAVIMFDSSQVLLSPNLSDSARQQLERIQQQVEYATNLIQQILDFSRNSARKPQRLDLRLRLEEILQFIKRTVPERFRIQFTYSQDDFTLDIDPTQIQQVVTNLVLNARDAMPDGGEIRFDLARLIIHDHQTRPCAAMPSGAWVMLSVSDSGVGIDMAALPHIFDPFFTTKAVGSGTGLGLAQVYGIVQQHSGCITVESEAGYGTTFSLYFPVKSN